jgi:hypothetical protein
MDLKSIEVVAEHLMLATEPTSTQHLPSNLVNIVMPDNNLIKKQYARNR